MVVSRRLLRWSGMRLRLLGLDSREELRHPRTKKHPAAPMDRVREQRALRKNALGTPAAVGPSAPPSLKHRRRRHAERLRRIDNGLGMFLRGDSSQDFLQQLLGELPGGSAGARKTAWALLPARHA
jgi:hypothetical protein